MLRFIFRVQFNRTESENESQDATNKKPSNELINMFSSEFQVTNET